MVATGWLGSSAEERCALALELGGIGSFVWSLEDNVAVGDACVGELFGVADPGEPKSAEEFLARVHEDDIEALRGAVDEALNDNADYAADFRVRRDDGSSRWVTGRGRVVRTDDGKAQLIGVNWDVSHRKEQEERLEMLAREMNHRVKNAFAVMLALIGLGSRSATDVKSFTETIKAQIQAMSDVHLVSARLGFEQLGDHSFSIGDIARMALAPWIDLGGAHSVIVEDDGSRLSVPKLSPLAMLLYELVTNAVKYGSLGRDAGSLIVKVEGDGDAVCLRWTEKIADTKSRELAEAENAEGVRSGFGSMLILHCTSTLGAKVKREMRAEGLRLELRIPR